MSVQRDCMTASLEGCCARISLAPSCASVRQECNAGPMERAAQVLRTRLGGIPSGAGDHSLLGIAHVDLLCVLLSNSPSPGFPMCQNFPYILLDAYTHKTSVHVWTHRSAQFQHRMTHIMPCVLSVESFNVCVKLLCTELLLEGPALDSPDLHSIRQSRNAEQAQLRS